MSKVESNSGRCSEFVPWEKAQNQGQPCKRHFGLALLILASMAFWLVTDNAWAQLQENEKVITVVNAYWVRLRSTPEIGSDTILTRVAGGAQLKYLGRQDDWFMVELPSGAEGWLHSRFGRLDTARDLLKVSATVARIRESRTLDAPVVERAIQGLMLEILDQQEDWYLVRLPLGGEGWIRNDLVTLHTVVPRSKQVETAQDQSTVTEDTDVAQAAEPPVERTGINLQEITPLPISAAAEEVPAHSAPALRSPQNPEKPRFLMLFISIVAGLSAFAVLLIVGAVAIRRKAENSRFEELPETNTPSSPEDEKVNQIYSDPLLNWMGDKTSGPAANGHKELQSESEPPGEPEVSIVSETPEDPVETTSNESGQAVRPLADVETPETTSPVDDSPLVSVAAVAASDEGKSGKSAGSKRGSRSSQTRRRRRRKKSSPRKSNR